MQGKENLHGYIIQSFAGFLPEVVEIKLSPLAGGEIEIGPLGQAVALLVPGELSAGDPPGGHVRGVATGIDAVCRKIVLQAAGLQTGLGFPVAKQAEGSGTGDAGSAKLGINKKCVGHSFSFFIDIIIDLSYTLGKVIIIGETFLRGE